MRLPPASPQPRRSRLILVAAAVLTLAAATAGALLLRETGPTQEGSREPQPSPAVSYLRAVCGEDVDLSQGAGMCVGRPSLSPSEIAKVLDNLPTGPD